MLVASFKESSAARDPAGAKGRRRTGYYVTHDLVLTAAHDLPEPASASMSVRVEQGLPPWREKCWVVWRDDNLDAALIRVDPPLSAENGHVSWGTEIPEGNPVWDSVAYPNAAVQPDDASIKTAGLKGTWYTRGGGGQGAKQLELGVDNPPEIEEWSGVSGAPVFVGDQFVGIVTSAAFNGNRLYGLAAYTLLQDVKFRLAISPELPPLPRDGHWVLVLLAEGNSKTLEESTRSSLNRHEELITSAIGHSLHDLVVGMRITDCLRSPEHWLHLVKALCSAPFMIADVTGFEPGIMLALGVRSVVRRGVTIASTSAKSDDHQLSALPFNIQETKPISHSGRGRGMSDDDPLYSLNLIAKTLLNGWRELRTSPHYLDLPAYDAVRCLAPEFPEDQRKARESALVLCPFSEKYADNWTELAHLLATRYPKYRIVRTCDIDSPRLIGQALYECIRWTRTCVVDWTDWRPNVLFEFGVRIACSDIEPVLLLESPDVPSSARSKPKEGKARDKHGRQKKQLIALFSPTGYAPTKSKLSAVRRALDVHERCRILTTGGAGPSRAMASVPYSGTHRMSLIAFEHAQEALTLSPQDLLRSSVETLLGRDRQKSGQSSVLFGANPELARDIRRSVRERWVATILYMLNRYGADSARHKELQQLGEVFLQEVRDDPGDAFVTQLRRRVAELVDPLENASASGET